LFFLSLNYWYTSSEHSTKGRVCVKNLSHLRLIDDMPNKRTISQLFSTSTKLNHRMMLLLLLLLRAETRQPASLAPLLRLLLSRLLCWTRCCSAHVSCPPFWHLAMSVANVMMPRTDPMVPFGATQR
jgi:hypothetical protein